MGDYQAADLFAEQALAKYRQMNSISNACLPLFTLQVSAVDQGKFEKSFQYGQERMKSTPQPNLRVRPLAMMGKTAILMGDLLLAESYLRQCVSEELWKEIDAFLGPTSDTSNLKLSVLMTWYILLAKKRSYLHAARIIGAVSTHQLMPVNYYSPRGKAQIAEAELETREALGAEAFQAAAAEGQAMSLDQAMLYVRNLSLAGSGEPGLDRSAASLSKY